jgi:hypothetical protein
MRHLEKIVPLSCLAFCLTALSPLDIFKFPISTLALIHCLSYAGLGIFFELPELSLNAFCLSTALKNDRLPDLKSILKIRYVLTHYIGPVTGLLTMASGIQLAWRGHYSLATGWLFWVLASSVLGLYKGMYQHNAYLRRLVHFERTGNSKRLRESLLSRFDQTLIVLEFPTYIFTFVTAWLKPAWINPFAGFIRSFEGHVSAWWSGVALVVCGFVWLVPLHAGMQRLSRVYQN